MPSKAARARITASRPKAKPRGGSRVPRPPTGVELDYLRRMRLLMKAIANAASPVFAALARPVRARADAEDEPPPVAPEVAGAIATPPAESAVLARELRRRVRRIVREHIEAGLVTETATAVNTANVTEMQRVLGVERRLLVTDAPMAEWTRANVELITSIGDEFLDQVEELVTAAGDSGMRAETLANALQERLGVAESRANLIARDQILKANAQLSEERMRRVGVEEYVWRATPDHRTRPDHKALDGRTFRFDDPPIVDRRTGARANPGEHFQCRCQAEPVFADD